METSHLPTFNESGKIVTARPWNQNNKLKDVEKKQSTEGNCLMLILCGTFHSKFDPLLI